MSLSSTRPLNILMIGPYPDEHGRVIGGVEAVTGALVPALAARDDVARVTVVVLGSSDTPARQVQQGSNVMIHYLPTRSRWRTVTRSRVDARQVREIVRDVDPDIIHGQGLTWDSDIAIQLGKPVVVTVHGLIHREQGFIRRRSLPARLRGALRTRLVVALTRRVLRRADLVISISAYDGAELNRLTRGKRVQIANPIAPEYVRAPVSDPDGARVLYAGTLLRRKNVTGLIRAFNRARARVPDARLVLAGPSVDPVYDQEIHDTIAALGLQDAVELPGHLDTEQLLDELRRCRVMALFSQQETLPTIIAQAQAQARPVVASRVGGIPEMIEDGVTGWIVDPDDEISCGDRLADLLAAPDVAHRMGQRARDVALERYDTDAVAEQTVAAYLRALRG
jgi:glycosyltransferase involved in cell wall biosynthesis